jgi:hypothetical protein
LLQLTRAKHRRNLRLSATSSCSSGPVPRVFFEVSLGLRGERPS